MERRQPAEKIAKKHLKTYYAKEKKRYKIVALLGEPLKAFHQNISQRWKQLT